jgi:hypothetical protein
MTYAAGTTVSQLGELVLISCCCTPNLFSRTAQHVADAHMKQLVGDFGERTGHAQED